MSLPEFSPFFTALSRPRRPKMLGFSGTSQEISGNGILFQCPALNKIGKVENKKASGFKLSKKVHRCGNENQCFFTKCGRKIVFLYGALV